MFLRSFGNYQTIRRYILNDRKTKFHGHPLVTCCVTIDGVWIGNLNYCTLRSRNYK
jgi:hypothetical protein